MNNSFFSGTFAAVIVSAVTLYTAIPAITDAIKGLDERPAARFSVVVGEAKPLGGKEGESGTEIVQVPYSEDFADGFNTTKGSFANGVYTAPEDGIYLVSASLLIGGGPVSSIIEVHVDSEGKEEGEKPKQIIRMGATSVAEEKSNLTVSGSTALKLVRGDDVSIWVNPTSGSPVVIPNSKNDSWFTIVKTADDRQ